MSPAAVNRMTVTYSPFGFSPDNRIVCFVSFVSFVVFIGVGSGGRQPEVTTRSPARGPKEYCPSEFFNISCSKDDVILMESARYGRMRAGRCVTGSYGYLGCSVDVLWYFNRMCSGYSQCRIHTMDPVLHRTEPCPKDLSSYLEAHYTCVTASTGEKQTCWNEGFTRLVAPSGYLSSLISIEQGFGTKDCPWRILALPGQRLKINLVAFGGLRPQAMESRRDDETVQSSRTAVPSGSVCYEVGTVIEGAKSSPLKVCAGETVEPPLSGSQSSDQHKTDHLIVYLSEGSNITVYLHAQRVLKELAEFLLKYETIGCPTIVAPPGGWVKLDQGHMKIGCNGVTEVWHMTCTSGGSWTGIQPNCSVYVQNTALDSNPDAIVQGDEPFPLGVLLVVAIGVSLGVFLGGILLTVVSVFMRRHGSNRQDRSQMPTSSPLAMGDAEQYDSVTMTLPRHVIRCSHHDDGKITSSNCPHVTTLMEIPFVEPAICSCLLDGRPVWMSDVDWSSVVTS